VVSVDSPAIARRHVRLALREARLAKELTQGQVAEAMEWSLSKVMRIESGEVTINPNDLRALLPCIGIVDPERVEELVQAARVSKRRRDWWDEPGVREYVTHASRQLMQYEAEATVSRHFYSLVIPGRLQTPAYAEAVMSSYVGEMPAEVIDARLRIRMRRRREFLARRPALRMYLLLDQSVLLREFGGRKVLAEQLSDLGQCIKDHGLMVRVVPFEGNPPIPMLGTYEILYLGEEAEEQAIMYRETHFADEVVDDVDKIRRHRDIFEQLWDAAEDPVVSAQLIEQRAQELLREGNSSPG
jgi:transcriptional regulator with XRE-family HTH domain